MGFSSRTGRAASASAFLGLLVLTGCSYLGLGQDDPAKGATCPSTGFVPELAKVTRFVGTDTNANNVTYTASLDSLKGSCTFDNTGAQVSMTFNILARRGPAGTDGAQNFDYFVAVTDENGNILDKRDFAAPLTFAAGQARAGSTEGPILVPVRVGDPKQAFHMHVLVGFQLTQAEHDFNTAARGQ